MSHRLRVALERGFQLISISVTLVTRSAAGDLDVSILA